MSTKREIKKLDFIFTKESLTAFIEKLSDLSVIDDYIVIKINKDDLLLYSVATDPDDKNKKIILAFKSYIFKTKELLTIKSDFNENLIFIVKDTKKTVRTLKMFFEYEDYVECSISYDKINDINFGDNFKLKNKKIKQNFTGGNPLDSNIKINLQSIKEKSTPELLDFKFNITKTDFFQAKKMSLIETENDVVYFLSKDKELCIAENRWSLTIDDNFTYGSDNDDDFTKEVNICIPKKYFKTATCDDAGLNVEVYRGHIIINNEKSSLMIARQMSII